jgi:hypothetical protein
MSCFKQQLLSSRAVAKNFPVNAFYFAMFVIIWSPLRALGLENFNGSLRLLGSSTKVDTLKTESIDQQYNINYTRPFLPELVARFSLNYHTLQLHQKGIPDNWHGELGPSGDISWSNMLFSAGANYRYWQVRDRIESNNSMSRGAGFFFRTKLTNLPQSNFQYDWNRFNSGSGYTPLNNEEWRFLYSTNYSYKPVSLYYSFSNRDFVNHINAASENLKQHIFRFDYGAHFFGQKLRLSTDYLFTASERKESSGSNPQPLIQLTPLLGLYLQDETPEISVMDTLNGLIDNDVTNPTSPVINIGGVFINQNIGLDLGTPRLINQLYIYTDRQSGNQVGWKVYTSEDNNQWSPLDGAIPTTFNLTFKRYEIILPGIQARYFKAANFGINDQSEVYVTEMQALINSTLEGNLPNTSQNHQVSANIGYKASPNVQFLLDGLWGSTLENNTGLQRQDANLTGTVSYKPSQLFASSARYRHALTKFQSASVADQKSDIYSLNFQSNPMRTLEFSLSGSHSEIFENTVLDQKLNSALFHSSALLFPRLSILNEVDFSRNERPSQNTSVDTWSYRISADATPYNSLNFIASYKLQRYSTSSGYLNGRRDEFDLNITCRMSDNTYLRSETLYNKEPNSESILQDVSLSWNLTDRISTDYEFRYQEALHSYRTQIINLQANYAFSARTNAFFSFSENRIITSTKQETTSLQAGFNTSF